MARCCIAFVLAVFCCSGLAAAGERIIVGDDGSVAGRFQCGNGGPQLAVLKFGLPLIPPAKTWRESQVLRSLWVTNGILYTQTVFVTGPDRKTVAEARAGSSNAVLLVNIRGENTNSEYAEAQAELAIQTGGVPLELELSDGAIWHLCRGSADSATKAPDGTEAEQASVKKGIEAETRVSIGVLEIPASGVKVSRGKVLKFSGNMPPSINGSMTLKIPLEPVSCREELERLQDMEFETELHRVLSLAQGSAAEVPQAKVRFAREKD